MLLNSNCIFDNNWLNKNKWWKWPDIQQNSLTNSIERSWNQLTCIWRYSMSLQSSIFKDPAEWIETEQAGGIEDSIVSYYHFILRLEQNQSYSWIFRGTRKEIYQRIWKSCNDDICDWNRSARGSRRNDGPNMEDFSWLCGGLPNSSVLQQEVSNVISFEHLPKRWKSLNLKGPQLSVLGFNCPFDQFLPVWLKFKNVLNQYVQ